MTTEERIPGTTCVIRFTGSQCQAVCETHGVLSTALGNTKTAPGLLVARVAWAHNLTQH